jgi:hypothetical protein
MEKKADRFGEMVIPVSMESLNKFGDAVMAEIEARESVFKEGAKHAFDAYIKYPIDDPILEATRDQKTGKIRLRDPAGEALDALIGNALNHRSIGYFVELVLEHHESANQAARAIKRHSENHAMKADVFAWLDSQTKFKSIEAAAMAITKQQPIAHVTGRDWYKEWKKLRSASTP